MNAFLQPADIPPDFLDNDPDGEEFLKALAEAEKVAAEATEQNRYNEDARRRALAADNVRREREEANISGALSPDAEMFRDITLKPKIREAHDFEPQVRTPIVQGLFFKNTLTWVAGSSGTFKSFITADLAFRYGAGMDYHGKRMTQGRALLVVAEGAAAYADRKTAWEKHHGQQVENVSIYPAPLQLGDTLKEMPALISYLKEEEAEGRPFGLILFDTQAMCTVGMDENSSEMNLVVNVLHRIREVSGACVMVVHHFGKQKGAGMRGSSMIYAAADTVCILNRSEDAMDVSISTAQGDGGKQKDAIAEKDILTFDMKAYPVGEDFFGDAVHSLVPVAVEGGSHDVQSEAEEAADLAYITDLQCYYLQALSGYRERGTSPSDFAKDAEVVDEDWPKLPPDQRAHRVTRQSARKIFIKMEAMKLVEAVKGDAAKWRMTALGGSAVMRHLSDREGLATAEKWLERASRSRVRRGVPNPGVNPELNPDEPWSEPPSDLQ